MLRISVSRGSGRCLAQAVEIEHVERQTQEVKQGLAIPADKQKEASARDSCRCSILSIIHLLVPVRTWGLSDKYQT